MPIDFDIQDPRLSFSFVVVTCYDSRVEKPEVVDLYETRQDALAAIEQDVAEIRDMVTRFDKSRLKVFLNGGSWMQYSIERCGIGIKRPTPERIFIQDE